MASFDFIEASAKGYSFTWQERGYLARVALPVLFVKTVCLLGVFVLGLQEQYVRQGLVLMPGHIVEAVFVVGLIRYALYREAMFIWGKSVPVPPTDEKYAPYQGWLNRKQCVQGGIVMYVLLKVIIIGISAGILDNLVVPGGAMPMPADEPVLPPLLGAVVLFSLLIAFTWVFRLVWLYIPIVMGIPLREFLKRISGLQSSVYMIATWLICFLPLIVVLVVGIQIFSGLLTNGSAAYILVRSMLEGAAELVIISVQVVAMTYGFTAMLSGGGGNK